MTFQDPARKDKPSEVRTPEGDNEQLPDEPLKPGTETEDMQPWPAIDTNKVGR